MRRLLLVLAVLFMAHPALAKEAPLNRLVADYEAWTLADNPFAAEREGDKAALSRLPDVTPAADAVRKRRLQAFQARLKAIPPRGLSGEARLNRDFLAWTLDRRLKSLAFDEARMPFNSDSGFDMDLGYEATTNTLADEAEARAWIARLAALPGYYEANVANARRGIATGFTQPGSNIEAVIARARGALAIPVDADPLLKPFATLPAAFPADRRAALRAEAAAIVRAASVPRSRRSSPSCRPSTCPPPARVSASAACPAARPTTAGWSPTTPRPSFRRTRSTPSAFRR